MKSAKIAELKSKLSYFLKQVRKGAEIIVLDRETPIARVVPFSESDEELRIQPPSKGFKGIKKLKFPPPKKKIDSLKVLLEDRRRK